MIIEDISIEGYYSPDLFEPDVIAFDERRSELLASTKRFLTEQKELVRQSHNDGASGREVVQALSRVHNVMLDAVFRSLSLDTEHPQGPCNLMAIGGYGRGELNPFSDIDIMFFYHQRAREYASEVAERLLYFSWDLGLDIGSCVRTVADCLEMSDRDLTVRTALLDARLICGDESLHLDFEHEVTKEVLRRSTQRFISEKLFERNERLHKYGSSVYLLEPNIKEGEGGLRDLQTALWMCMVKFKVRSMRELVTKGVISEPDYDEYQELLDHLWRIRNELHYLSNRKNEQIHFDQQEKIAAVLGYKKSKRALAVEQFMQDYYATALRVEHISSSLINLASRRDESHNRLLGLLRRRNIGEGFVVLHGELALSDQELFSREPAMIMRAFELMQYHDAPMKIELKTSIREHLHLINDKVRRSKQMTTSFLNILRFKKRVGKALREMHHLKVLNSFIPEFAKIYCRVQYDLYHIYTVDIHSLFAIEEVEKLWSGEYAEDRPLATQVAADIDRPELLLLGVLLHDVGKGSGSDHANRGGDMIPTIARRLGLSKEDSMRLEFLVRKHLLMPHLSQRRDLHDDRLIADFSRQMEMSENLRLLFILSFADIRTVGPNVWSEWKWGLLKELFEKSYNFLEKGNFQLEERSQKVRNRRRKVYRALIGEFSEREMKGVLQSMTTRYILSHRSAEIIDHMRVFLSRKNDTLAFHVEHCPEYGHSQVIISTVDFPGLFSKVTGVMAANGINILGAQVYTSGKGVALDVLQVRGGGLDLVVDPARWQKVQEDLIEMIEGRLRVTDLVSRRRSEESVLLDRHRPKFQSRIIIDNDVSREHTVVDIYTADKLGVLYDITRVFKDLGLYIGVSKISTKVDQAADTFYVKDIFGQKLHAPEKLEDLTKKLYAVLDDYGDEETNDVATDAGGEGAQA